MLFPAELRLGVRRHRDTLHGHAWVEHAGRAIGQQGLHAAHYRAFERPQRDVELLPSGFRLPPDCPNVLLISIDSLRPDHLGCYGYERDTMPLLEAFARRHGRVFDRAISSGASSLPP